MKKYLLLIILIVSIGLGCSKNDSTTNGIETGNGTGKGGSLARFTIAMNHLYILDTRSIKVYDITNVTPVFKTSIPLNSDIETLFSYNDKLFVGSMSGMFIYSIANPDNPTYLSEASHVRACDPVVADQQYSYVTLKKGTACGESNVEALLVYDVSNITFPSLKSTTELPSPGGLGLIDKALYVCCANNGLYVLDVTNPNNPSQKQIVKDSEIYMDVIPVGNMLIAYTTTGIVLFDITNRFAIQRLTKVNN